MWSGLKGASLSQSLRSVLSGQKPADTQADPISVSPESRGLDAVAPGSNLGSTTGDLIASTAEQYKGAGYVWDGAPANGIGQWDCSSFANFVLGMKLGLAIPGYGAGKYTGTTHGPNTVAWLAWTGCTTVGHDGNVAQPGDLAVWQTHMGICLGPNQMISAHQPGAVNETEDSGINGFIPEFLFIRRLRAVSGG